MELNLKTPLDAAREVAATIGRKFTDDDMTPELRRAALDYILEYTGDFEFVVDLRRKKKLSIGQLRGALNVMRAEVLRAMPVPTEAVGDEATFAAIIRLFRTATDSKLAHPKLRLATAEGQPVELSIAGPKAKCPGSITVTSGGGYWNAIWYGRVTPDGVFEPSRANCPAGVCPLLRQLAADPAETLASYGRLTGNCGCCTKPLTDERSTLVGYGPVCAKKWGLPWGARKEESAA